MVEYGCNFCVGCCVGESILWCMVVVWLCGGFFVRVGGDGVV